ncbi:carboxypeptidase-like regulatory domain-containing protein [Sphingobacterium sp. GVS05A]|uniref:carboxypeptidase-like regulatory domain-containing protein n=1 Tax=Sphingobacterium TaxID=28453 RepID=UPI001CBEEBE1|nr:carboxypeptidase-like regulatory domain-containing protein [Sphingobacterium sp. GVS05A]
MKTLPKILSINLLLFLCCSIAYAQKAPQWVLPTTPFNEAETARLMERGSATIEGTATLKKKGKDNFGVKGSQILLFPVTPYFTEFLELKKKFNNRKKQATMSPVAFTYRIEGRFLDDKGTFQFTNLKPGKYYIISWIAFARQKTVAVQTGTSTSYNVYGYALGSSPIYEDYHYDVFIENEVSGFVEVNEAGAVVNVMVSN